MEKDVILICTPKPWNDDLVKNLRATLPEYTYIRCRDNVEFERLRWERAKHIHTIFFPHWGLKIPKEIYEKYRCIGFHTGWLPNHRGGSPIQNLIKAGYAKAPVNAIQIVEGMDEGSIYCSRIVQLLGTAEEIFIHINMLIEDMIRFILKYKPEPIRQASNSTQSLTKFRRLKPEDSDLTKKEHLLEIYDQIRMVDAEGYPHAYVDFGNFRITFRNASLRVGEIVANVEIKEKK